MDARRELDTLEARQRRDPEELRMKGKILLATGLAIGYVLGTRAGRERFEQIKAGATRFWNDPRVQKQVHTAEDFVKDKAPEVAEFVGDQAKKVTSTAAKGGTKKPRSTATTPRRSTSSSS
jgi:hypothetical protein